jgi:hypothetical protein
LKFVSTSATATLPQMAIVDFLANGSFDHHVRKSVAITPNKRSA